MKTDAQLKCDIQDELEWDPEVSATDIGVQVRDGLVTLTGTLQTYAEKRAAEQAPQRVDGVRAVVSELRVQLGQAYVRGDTDIAAAALHALHWNSLVPEGRVRLQVEKGWIKLQGEVEWEYHRRAAERAVRDLLGVVGITNQIAVRPRISPVDIQRGIERALTRHAEREAKHLQVRVDGSRVVLSGTVGSWAELQAAQGAAWSAPGVTSVSSELHLR